MIFGDRVNSAAMEARAEWIEPACQGARGSVGWLVPNQYPSILSVSAPTPVEDPVEDWWAAYRRLFAVIAEIGERHTSTPDRAGFGVWEGHGFDTATTQIAWREPADDATRELRDQQRSTLADEDLRRNAATRAALRQIPRFVRPDRAYYVLVEPVAAATELRTPLAPEVWQRPDLYWPDDRSWFVATDVDFWRLYDGGTHELTSEIADAVPTPSEIVSADDRLEPED